MGQSSFFENIFLQSIEVKTSCVDIGFDSLVNMGDRMIGAIEAGNKVMLCGNGGSAADAQHLAAEMLVRLRPMNNREGVPVISLALDTSTITACGNDFGYDQLYERMVTTLGQPGDCLLGITTSGNSKNIIYAMIKAKAMGINVSCFLGSGGGEALNLCDNYFLVPSNDTARVQESRIVARHGLMEYVEDGLLASGFISVG